jgi:hypothetical protein
MRKGAVEVSGGMRLTSTDLYFYRALKKGINKSGANLGNVLFQINYGLIIIYNFYVYSFYPELTGFLKN